MADKGERAIRGDHRGNQYMERSGDPTIPTLSDIGISKDQSSKYQQLAEIPDRDFEKALNDPDTFPSTQGVIHRAKGTLPKMPPPVNGTALWLCGTLQDFEREGMFTRDPNYFIDLMPVTMREHVERIVPLMIEWLSKINLEENK